MKLIYAFFLCLCLAADCWVYNQRAKYAGGMGFMGVELREEAAAVTAAAPAWLGPLLGARFFQPCAAHPNLNGNHYCLDCAGEDDAVSCPRCLSGHRSHHVVQVCNLLTCVA